MVGNFLLRDHLKSSTKPLRSCGVAARVLGKPGPKIDGRTDVVPTG